MKQLLKEILITETVAISWFIVIKVFGWIYNKFVGWDCLLVLSVMFIFFYLTFIRFIKTKYNGKVQNS